MLYIMILFLFLIISTSPLVVSASNRLLSIPYSLLLFPAMNTYSRCIERGVWSFCNPIEGCSVRREDGEGQGFGFSLGSPLRLSHPGGSFQGPTWSVGDMTWNLYRCIIFPFFLKWRYYNTLHYKIVRDTPFKNMILSLFTPCVYWLQIGMKVRCRLLNNVG